MLVKLNEYFKESLADSVLTTSDEKLFPNDMSGKNNAMNHQKSINPNKKVQVCTRKEVEAATAKEATAKKTVAATKTTAKSTQKK